VAVDKTLGSSGRPVCTRCGSCCKAIPCGIGVVVLGQEEGSCSAPLIRGGGTRCMKSLGSGLMVMNVA
jgi:hypothetical protein